MPIFPLQIFLFLEKEITLPSLIIILSNRNIILEIQDKEVKKEILKESYSLKSKLENSYLIKFQEDIIIQKS